MESKRTEQVEALEVLVDFNDRLVHNVKILIKELSGSRLPDTNQLMKGILDAMNWEIEVMNGTMEVLNEGEQRIDKEAFNKKVIALGEAVASHKDDRMAAAFQELLPYFEQLGDVAKIVVK